MTTRLLLMSATLVFLSTGPVCAKDDPVQDLSGWLRPVQERAQLPAMGVAIVRSNGLVGLGVSGVRAQGDKTPVTKDDRWHLGSCTKAMTATLVARLVEKKTLRFDDTLDKHLSKAIPKLHEGFKPVTLALLLQNRGGAPADLNARGLWGRLWVRDAEPRAKRMELMADVLTHAPVNEPGTAYVYANAGFAIAGGVAEHATDTAWEDLMREHLFKPLGMKSAGFGAPGTAEKISQPRGHRWVDGAWQPVAPGPGADNPPAIGPAGTVHATLSDWGRFVSAHLRGGKGKPPFLEPETFERMHTPPKGQPYAMGWIATPRPWGQGIVLTHSGSNTMWYCVTWIAPKADFAVLVTCNAGGDDAAKACDQAASAAIRHHLEGK